MAVEEILKELNSVKNRALRSIGMVRSRKSLDAAQSRYLGRKGHISELLRQVSALPDEARPLAGQTANSVKAAIVQAIEDKNEELKLLEQEVRILDETLDVTLPGAEIRLGRRHPLTLVGDRILRIFQAMGFSVARGPEMETEYHNFDALNLPRYHPAHDRQDAYYVAPDTVLCTHAAPVSLRYMLDRPPPIAVMCPCAVRRRNPEQPDVSTRRRILGLMVNESASFANLKGILGIFVREMFGAEAQFRLRPAYFPHTEPGCRLDLLQQGPDGGVDDHWVGIIDAGLLHPVVFEHVGYDPVQNAGIVFEMAVETIAQVLFGLADTRLLYDNELRFLEQF